MYRKNIQSRKIQPIYGKLSANSARRPQSVLGELIMSDYHLPHCHHEAVEAVANRNCQCCAKSNNNNNSGSVNGNVTI